VVNAAEVEMSGLYSWGTAKAFHIQQNHFWVLKMHQKAPHDQGTQIFKIF